MTRLNLINEHFVGIEPAKKIISRLLLLALVVIFTGGIAAAQTTFTVTNTTDNSDPGSLRWAIGEANAEAGESIIEFDIPGEGPHIIQPQTQYTSFTNPITVGGTTQAGYADGAPVIVLDGSLTTAAPALVFTASADNSTVRGLSIINFESLAIRLVSSSNTIEGNFIGLDPSGIIAGNGVGIGVGSSTGNQIGGTASSQRNVISGNNIGIDLEAGSGQNVIEGNYIGTTPDGTAAAGNKFNVQVRGSSNNRIGGSTPEQRNIIAGAFIEVVDGENEGGSGIVITSGFLTPENRIDPIGNTVQGNYIGTDVTGNVALSNERAGVLLLFGATENQVGGSAPGEGNLISGNGQYGIFMQGETDAPVQSNDIQGNIIGLNATQTAELGNTAGIFLWGENNDNMIGEITAGAENIIAGNSNSGIILFEGGSGNSILGNLIGLNESGDPFGNGVNGITIEGSSGNFIGGTNSDDGNIIANNSFNGIEISQPTGFTSMDNSILGNRIYNNGGIGIDHSGDGLTSNDDLDADTGPNNLQNFPEISSYNLSSDQLSITYSLPSDPANTSYPVRIEFFRANTNSTQALDFLGADSYTSSDFSSGNKFITITLPASDAFGEGDLLVATATDASGNTSELSPAVIGLSVFVVTNTNDTGGGSLRQAMTLSEFSPQPAIIQFNIPGDLPHTISPESPLPTLVKPVIINGTTQPGYFDGTFEPTPVIEISGVNAGSASGITIIGGNTLIQALAINQFTGNGIDISQNGGNQIINNFIGTTISGDAAASNGASGVFINNVPNNEVVGNLISGNTTGVFLQEAGATGNLILENFIGMDLTGSSSISNSGDGIRLGNGPNDNDISDNLISGNGANGIYIFDFLENGTSSNRVTGNIIGTNEAVTDRLPNQRDGIRIEQSDNNLVNSNILSGNNSNGIEIVGEQSSENIITGNIIGLADDGITKLSNQFSGVALSDAMNNSIGGEEASSGNLISGNGGIFDGIFLRASGIWLSGNSSGNRIQGNYIGTDLNGTTSSDTGNSDDGIKVDGESGNNVIGLDETLTGLGNIIGGNGAADASGVTIVSDNSLNNRISGNSIFDNSITGIDLGDDGITENDEDDSVTGPNNLLNFPVLTSAVYDEASTELTAAFSVPSDPANSAYPLRIEFYKNSGNRQGEVYLGSARYEAADFGADKEVVVTVPQSDLIAEGDEVTALSISATGNTSEFGGTVLVESAITAPEAPALATPANNAVDVSVSPVFTWQASTDAATYDIQVSTVSNFSSAVVNETGITETEFQSVQLSYSTPYFWRVRAVNEAGQSNWSTAWSFTTEDEPQSPPEVVVLSSPADGAVDVPNSPTLSWETSVEAVSYIVQVSPTNDFATLIVDEDGVTATELAVSDLSYETPHHWRVRAVNEAGQSDWSTAWSFTTEDEPQSPPEVVVLSSPADGAVDVPISPTLSWETSSDAASYIVQVSPTNDFATLIVDQDGVTATELAVTDLAYETQHYWRVRAVNEAGQSDWSTAWSFTTEDEPQSPPETVVLSSPADGAVDVPISPTLSWETSSDAASYIVQVSPTNDFATLIVDEDGVTATVLAVSDLSYETPHHWRVRAVNEAGQSDWSTIRSFTTEEEPLNPPGIVILDSPIDGATDISTSVTFSWQQEGLADTYQIQVSEDQQFLTSQIDEQGIAETSYDASNLLRSTLYYWRIRAQNSDGTGDWSTIWSFTTADLTPPVSVTVSVVNNSPRISWDAGSEAATLDINVYRGNSPSA